MTKKKIEMPSPEEIEKSKKLILNSIRKLENKFPGGVTPDQVREICGLSIGLFWDVFPRLMSSNRLEVYRPDNPKTQAFLVMLPKRRRKPRPESGNATK